MLDEFAAGFDHIFYGWIFFALVVAMVLAGAWRFFECDPEDYGYTAEAVAEQRWIDRFETGREGNLAVVVGVAALAVLAGASLAVLG